MTRGIFILTKIDEVILPILQGDGQYNILYMVYLI
jgi:hypothetical protein